MNSEISPENGKCTLWDGILNLAQFAYEQKFLIHDSSHTLKFIIDKRRVIIKEEEVNLLSILPSTLAEQTHAKVTENKYSQLLISTISHDLKSPITVIQGNLEVINQYINPEGLEHLKAAQVSATTFEYYIYDLVVLY